MQKIEYKTTKEVIIDGVVTKVTVTTELGLFDIDLKFRKEIQSFLESEEEEFVCDGFFGDFQVGWKSTTEDSLGGNMFTTTDERIIKLVTKKYKL